MSSLYFIHVLTEQPHWLTQNLSYYWLDDCSECILTGDCLFADVDKCQIVLSYQLPEVTRIKHDLMFQKKNIKMIWGFVILKNFVPFLWKLYVLKNLVINFWYKIMNLHHEILRKGYAGHLWMWIYQVHNLPTLKAEDIVVKCLELCENCTSSD